MRFYNFVVLSLCLAGTTLGQQEFGFYSGSPFTSRGNLGVNAGELLQGFHKTHHRGLGDRGNGCVISGARLVVQDQNAATQETYSVIFRGGSDTRGPYGAAIATIGPFQTPRATGGAAWRVTIMFTTPVKVPCKEFFALGVKAPAASGWTTDGFSVHTFVMPACANARLQDHAWDVMGSTARHPGTTPSSWRMGLLINDAALLQMGTASTPYGIDGMFPTVGCSLTALVTYPKAKFGAGQSLLFAGTARMPSIPLFRGTAGLYLSGAVFFATSVTINPSGLASHPLTTSMPVLPAGYRIHFQAVGQNGTNIEMSNSHTILP